MLDIIVTNIVTAIVVIIITRLSISLNSVDLLKEEFVSIIEYMIHDINKFGSLIRLILRAIWANFGTRFHDVR